MKKASAMKNQRNMQSAKKGTFARLLKYLFKYYGWQIIIMCITLLMVSAGMLVGNVYMQKLIDDVITPALSQNMPWSEASVLLVRMGATMVLFFVLGVIGSVVNNQLNAIITQGTLYHFRKDMFNNMESLPIKYFDTHKHGTIMSTYTNDTDAVRQLIGNSLPVLFQSAFTLVAVFIVMLTYSVYLTLIVVAVILLMLFVVVKIGGASGKYMVAQQVAVADEEGYIEEMINGQKVVKVFNHEDAAKQGFDKLNDKLNDDSRKAHTYGNILMPILGNMGNLLYVLLAFIGGLLVISEINTGFKNVGITGFNPLTVGVLVSFLSLSRQLSNNIGNIAGQISMVTMGLAGASRVFDMIDEQQETDNGYVMLVNATKDENGNIAESEKRTGLWAWKHYHKETDTTTYVELKGDIELDDVDFGYVPDKLVLHGVSLRAKPGQKFAFVGATGAGGSAQCYVTAVEDAEIFEGMVDLHERKTGEKLTLSDGAVITEKLAKLLGVSRGDEITVKISDSSTASVRVAGITEHYASHYLYLTQAQYEEAFGAAPEYNIIYFENGVSDDEAAQDAFCEKMLKNDDVLSVMMKYSASETFTDMMKILDLVIVVLIVSAGALAFVVLYNLTNVNITERIREIATLKVLGFYDREVASYVFRENIILSVMGALAGLLLGRWLCGFVVTTAEIDEVMFGRSVHFPSYVWAFLITVAFSLLINLLMTRTLRRISMVESLKSVE